MHTVTLVLPKHRIPSQNKTRRMHWAALRKLLRAAEWEVTAARLAASSAGQRVWPAVGEHVAVHVHSYRVRKLDSGNLVGGAKDLIDAVVNTGLATDDDESNMTNTYQQTVVKRADERTEITIVWDTTTWGI